MKTSIALALLVIGVVLLVAGLNASTSLASDAVRAVSGTPTNRSILLIASGTAGIAIGGRGLFCRCQREGDGSMAAHNP
jgi:hypothetical protein